MWGFGRAWHDEIGDEEDADMQHFVENLDFEDYYNDWLSLATSVSTQDLMLTL